MFCRDQMYSSFRAWELVQAAERREGFAFAAVLRARADLYWSSPLPSLCRSIFFPANRWSLTGEKDLWTLFPRARAPSMGNAWSAHLLSRSSECVAALSSPDEEKRPLLCGSSLPESVYLNALGGDVGGVAPCWPSVLFAVNGPFIYRGEKPTTVD